MYSKMLKHIKRFNEADLFNPHPDPKPLIGSDRDFLFYCYYLTDLNRDNYRRTIYQINDILTTDESNVLDDWKNASESTKERIIQMIKESISTWY